MTIKLRPAARDTLRTLDKPVRRRLQHAIDGLGRRARPATAIELSGQPGALRLPVGDHQIVYTIDDRTHDQEVLILLIDNRNAF